MIKKRRNSPFWQAQFWHDGKLVRISTKEKDRRKAEKEAARLQLTYSPVKANTLLAAIKDRYLRYAYANKRLNVYKLEVMILDRFCSFAGDQEISPLLIEDYKAERLLSVGRATVNREFNAIQAMFKQTVIWKMLDESPCREVKRFKIDSRRKSPPFWTSEQIDLILFKSEGSYIHDMILLACNTGLRKTELIYLEWADINFAHWLLTVQGKDDLNWKPKSGELRVVPIPETCHGMLRERKVKSLSQFVFANELGGPRVNNLTRDLRRLLQKIGLYEKGLGWHTFRHTYASHLAMEGTPLNSIAELLGHADPKTTKIYAHLTQSHLKEMVGRLRFGEKNKVVRMKEKK